MLLKIKFSGRKDEVHAYVRSRGMSCEQDVRDELNAMEQKIRAHAKKQIEGGFYCADPNDRNYYDLEKDVGNRRFHVGNVYKCGGLYQYIEEEFIPDEGWVSYVIVGVDVGHYSPQSEFHIAMVNSFFLDGKCIKYVSVTVEGRDRIFTVYKDKNRKNESIWKTRN
jgi:hypothetical protein